LTHSAVPERVQLPAKRGGSTVGVASCQISDPRQEPQPGLLCAEPASSCHKFSGEQARWMRPVTRQRQHPDVRGESNPKPEPSRSPRRDSNSSSTPLARPTRARARHGPSWAPSLRRHARRRDVLDRAHGGHSRARAAGSTGATSEAARSRPRRSLAPRGLALGVVRRVRPLAGVERDAATGSIASTRAAAHAARTRRATSARPFARSRGGINQSAAAAHAAPLAARSARHGGVLSVKRARPRATGAIRAAE